MSPGVIGAARCGVGGARLGWVAPTERLGYEHDPIGVERERKKKLPVQLPGPIASKAQYCAADPRPLDSAAGVFEEFEGCPKAGRRILNRLRARV